jgi:hypothetical protein
MKTIDDVLQLDDAHRKTVLIPEWENMEIVIVSMTAAERADIERRWAKKDASTDPAAFRCDVLTACLKHWATAEQVKQLLGKNARAVERLFTAACEVSGFAKDDIEDERKN